MTEIELSETSRNAATKVKICGLTQTNDVDAVNRWRPDYVGFVFAPKSRRCVDPARAAELKKRLAPEILAVGVFVDEAIRNVAELANRGVVDAIQLHGDEDADYIARLRTSTDKPIVQAFRIASPDDARRAQESVADCVLLDSTRGGSGETFRWNWTRLVERPYFLAGGLNLDNVKNAVETLRPFAADVSSGVETNGRKDEEKIREFIRAVRGRAVERKETKK